MGGDSYHEKSHENQSQNDNHPHDEALTGISSGLVALSLGVGGTEFSGILLGVQCFDKLLNLQGC